jgi:hypothetical protein
MLRLMGLPPPGAFPDVAVERDAAGLVLRFGGGAGDERTVEVPLWTLEGQDPEAAQLSLLARLQELGYRASLAR